MMPVADAPLLLRPRNNVGLSDLQEWRKDAIESLAGPVLAILFQTFLMWPIITAENFGRPLGRIIPDELPQETRRVRHPGGFSLVYPRDWDVRTSNVSTDMVSIGGSPRVLLPARRVGGMGVFRFRDMDLSEVTKHRKVQFQGEDAYEEIWTKEGNWDDPPGFSYTLYFRRAGVWYQIGFSAPLDLERPPPVILRYFSTFRVEGAESDSD
jgi:hypothetical protein